MAGLSQCAVPHPVTSEGKDTLSLCVLVEPSFFSFFNTSEKSKEWSVRFQSSQSPPEDSKSLPGFGKHLTFLTDLPVLLQVAERLMTIAYESGVNLFDTAEVYAAGK